MGYGGKTIYKSTKINYKIFPVINYLLIFHKTRIYV